MNLILLTPAEAAAQPVVLRDRRAVHAHEVLRARAGDLLRVGILEGPLGQAQVVGSDADELRLECSFDTAVAAPGADTLVLAVPRPIVLARCLAAAAAMGYGRILLFRSRRVDRSYLSAKVLQPAATRARLLAGLEQGMRTRVPEVGLFDRFRPFVEDHLAGLTPSRARILADPGATTRTADLRLDADTGYALALGPEGGFVPFEVEALGAIGFTPVTCGPHPLRVETALGYLTGQLDLLRSRRAAAPGD
jgi:RsmE family RNA methyltransferase